MNYLSEEDQFKESLTPEQIKLIKNSELREIRERYWHLKREAFLDEYNIPDKALGEVTDRLTRKEQEEIQVFKKNNNR